MESSAYYFLFVILGLLCFCSYLTYRLVRLNQGVQRLNESLVKSQPSHSLRDLPEAARQRQLEELSRSALNTMSEATLSLASETAHRRFVEALLNEIDDGLIVVNREYEVQFCNRAARHLFPSGKDYIGRPLISLCFDHRVIDTVDLSHSLLGKTQDQISHRDPYDKTKTRTLLIESEPLLESHGVGEGAWILVRDITQQVETDQIRRDFVANASHEFRTPLSILAGYLEMIDEQSSTDPELMSRYAETMRRHCTRLARIVEDMLAISKLESSHEMLNFEEFDMAECIEEVIENLNPIVESEEATVTFKYPEAVEDRIILGDPFYWDQIFFNLVENAIKMNSGAGVEILINLEKESADQMTIQITDDGVGIPASDIAHVFKRFFRVEKHHARSSSKSTTGTGLGLSIVKRGVEAHSGKISVESQPGTNTTFTISVPTTPQLPKKKLKKKKKRSSLASA